ETQARGRGGIGGRDASRPPVLETFVELGLLAAFLGAALVLDVMGDHAVQRALAGVAVGPVRAHQLQLALLAGDLGHLLGDRLVDALHEGLPVEHGADAGGGVAAVGVFVAIAMQFAQLVFGARQLLLLRGETGQRILAALAGLVHGRLQSFGAGTHSCTCSASAARRSMAWSRVIGSSTSCCRNARSCGHISMAWSTCGSEPFW